MHSRTQGPDYPINDLMSTADNDTAQEMAEEGFPMSVIVTGFFVTSLAYLVCFCCCIIQFFLRRRQNNATPSGGSVQNAIALANNQKNDTLKKRFLLQFRNSLRRFKKARPSVINTHGEVSGLCSICLVEYTGPPSEIFVGYIKACGHYFHFDCIWTWLESRGNCPLCRQKVFLKEDDIRGFSLKHVQAEHKDKIRDSTPPPDHTWTVPMSNQSAPAAPSSDTGSSNGTVELDQQPAPADNEDSSSTRITIRCSVEYDNPVFEHTDGDSPPSPVPSPPSWVPVPGPSPVPSPVPASYFYERIFTL